MPMKKPALCSVHFDVAVALIQCNQKSVTVRVGWLSAMCIEQIRYIF